MYAIWFTFQKDDEYQIQDLINKLSKKYNSNSFKPHITAYGLLSIGLDKISKVCQDISDEFKPFDVQFLNISYSDDFWKTFFVNLKPNKIMTEIYNKFSEKIEEIENYVFEPHISLIYNKMSIDEKKELLKTIKMKKQFKINSISILHYSDKIENWKIVKKINLKIIKEDDCQKTSKK